MPAAVCTLRRQLSASRHSSLEQRQSMLAVELHTLPFPLAFLLHKSLGWCSHHIAAVQTTNQMRRVRWDRKQKKESRGTEAKELLGVCGQEGGHTKLGRRGTEGGSYKTGGVGPVVQVLLLVCMVSVFGRCVARAACVPLLSIVEAAAWPPCRWAIGRRVCCIARGQLATACLPAYLRLSSPCSPPGRGPSCCTHTGRGGRGKAELAH